MRSLIVLCVSLLLMINNASTITSTTASSTETSRTSTVMVTTPDDFKRDPCNHYTTLDENWRRPGDSYYYYYYYYLHDDSLVQWDGWYRLYLQGESAQMSEWCVSSMSCGGYTPLSLGGSHPELEDGIVTREIYGSNGSQCTHYTSKPIKVKACPGDYYVYKLVRPDVWIPTPTYCAVTIKRPDYDPCDNYTSLDQPWRATNASGLNICDSYFNWNGWYRLLYHGMNIQMPESCVDVNRCGTYYPLWLNGPHPQIEDGVVTRQVCGNAGSDCCYFKSSMIQVKACPGNYYVYEFVRPDYCNMAYCADANTTVPATPSNSDEETNVSVAPTDHYHPDPCSNHTVLHDDWRSVYGSYNEHDDTITEWDGWYRFYLQGTSAKMADWCANFRSCGGYTPLILAGSHPKLKDGVVTRDVYALNDDQCSSISASHPIQVKVCPGGYYVYRLVKPDVSIPMPTYCAVLDPCDNYNVLDQTWRATNNTVSYSYYSYYSYWWWSRPTQCDAYTSWNGWYRLSYLGRDAQMPEYCVNQGSCGTEVPLWLSGSHPRREDGVVTRRVCGNQYYQCCYHSYNIQVKACPGNYYVYEFVRPVTCPSAYCADLNTITYAPSNETSSAEWNMTNATTPHSLDPCRDYTALDDDWRSMHSTYSDYSVRHDDRFTQWDGWYRMYLRGKSAQIPEWCVRDAACGGNTPLWLNASHPQVEDGVVTQEVFGSAGGRCFAYRSKSIQIKACGGDYYVYRFIKPDISIPVPTYCAVTDNPCNSYTSLDQPWRASNEPGLDTGDHYFNWNGWYRLLYDGMSIRMPESCVDVNRCGTHYPLWLVGPHPQIEEGVVTRQVCGNDGSNCCFNGYTTIQVKACPGNYYVYEFVSPGYDHMAYCADGNTTTPREQTSAETEGPTNSTTAADSEHSDPCSNYKLLNDDWRRPYDSYYGYYGYYSVHDDTLMRWDGWYRLYLQGESAQMSEWCVSSMSCGGHTPLSLGGSHPELEDGIVTREIYGSNGSQCTHYTSKPIKVKACPGDYYVYKLVRPDVWIPKPTYCAVTVKRPDYDPCDNYTSLDQPWRATNASGLNICDFYFNWNGWYRLLYHGMNIQMPESCVDVNRCGTYYPLWLNGPHPQIEDGVVTRQVCGNAGSDCCYFKSSMIQVKACPGNYSVYEFVRPDYCNMAYCADANTTVPATPSNSDEETNMSITPTDHYHPDPCSNHTVLHDDWRSVYGSYNEHDDTITDWDGWYRFYLQGTSAKMADWCANFRSCGGYTPLILAGSHPKLKDGVVTRDVYALNDDQCSSLTASHPINVKACPGGYYVYRLVKPDVSIPMPTYCAVLDPCDNYNVLDQTWRATNNTVSYSYYSYWWWSRPTTHCDSYTSWNGWYRLTYLEYDARMPEYCVNQGSCGTEVPLWLSGSHPRQEDGVVTRRVCGNQYYQCCYHSYNIQVKACPGNYYVYEFVRPVTCLSAYCADLNTITYAPSIETSSAESTMTNATTPHTLDPCRDYTALDDDWRSMHSTYSDYSDRHDDRFTQWDGWYRMYLQGKSAQIPEWCVRDAACGGNTPLWLNGSHPQVEDGVVTQEVFGSAGGQCFAYRSKSIQIKACRGGYYVYKFSKPDISIPIPTYCAVTDNPCNSYTSLDQPWRASNEPGLDTGDHYFNWNGWYRLLYDGMSIRMPESCVDVNRCGTHYPLWLVGPHPQIEEGVVTRQVCGNDGSNCCFNGYTTIQVKACPGNYYVYEFVSPGYDHMAYCADGNTTTPREQTSAETEGQTNSSTAADSEHSDPCSNYTLLNDDWRRPYDSYYDYYEGHDDTLTKWNGWYRLYLQGESAQMSEWCVSSMSCGGYTPLSLGGSHPELEDGIVTREIYGSNGSQCTHYTSKPIKVKACPGDYYVYKLIRPDVWIPKPTYCAVTVKRPDYDPCNNYTSLDQPWRATNASGWNICDFYFNWNGWYRLLYHGMNIQMPESCVDVNRCGTYYPLWLNGPHPQIEDGVVTRQVCGNAGSDCCYYKSTMIQVKACPGNYSVYEFVRPDYCNVAYCADVNSITPNTSPATDDFITSTAVTLDPCEELNCTRDEWCGKKNGVYGCFCNKDYPRSNLSTYDAVEVCQGSSGTVSLSRCQLFEAGFMAQNLHLSDPSCRGAVQDGRLVFYFDHDANICGTDFTANGTHFIYKNYIQGVSTGGFIVRPQQLELHFSCIYQLTQTLTMEKEFNPLQSVVHKSFVSEEGMYQVRIIPYQDAAFSQPYNGSLDIEVDQRIYIGVFVQGVDSRQIAAVMDSCWATPVNDGNSSIRWDLIVNECPNPEDDSVEMIENGNSTTGRFSFKMFSFTGSHAKVFLHCRIHLCSRQGNNCAVNCDADSHQRVFRSVDLHDSTLISMGPFIRTAQSTGE